MGVPSSQANGPSSQGIYVVANAISSTDAFVAVFNTRNPTAFDFNYPIKKRWINTSDGTEWILDTYTNQITPSNPSGQTLAVWLQISGGSGPPSTSVEQLTPDLGGAVLPTANNINVFGNTVANATYSKPVYTDNAASSTMDVNVQVAAAIPSSNIASVGLASFDSSEFTVDANGFVQLSTSPTAGVTQLTPNVGGAVLPVSGNINVFGFPAGATNVVTTYNESGNFEIENRSWMTKYVVDPSATPGAQGTYTTITAALTQAIADGATQFDSPTIFIRTGTYTEGITIPTNAFVNLQAFTEFENTGLGNTFPCVNIIGNVIFGTGCNAVFKNLNFTASTGDTISVGEGVVSIYNCNVSNTGVGNCLSVISSPTQFTSENSIYRNAVSIAVASTVNVYFEKCALSGSTSISSTSNVQFYNCTISNSFSFSGTATGTIVNSGFYTPNTESIVNNAGTVALIGNDFNTGGSPVLSGTGTFNVSENTMTGQGSLYPMSIRANVNQILSQTGNLVKSRVVSTNTTLTQFDYYVGVSGNSGAVTLTLPLNSTLGVDQFFYIKDEGGTATTNNITIAPQIGTIDGISTFVINLNYGAVNIRYDGTNFYIF